MPRAQKHISLPALGAAFTIAASCVCTGQPAEAQAYSYDHPNYRYAFTPAIDEFSPEDLSTDSHNIIHLMMHKFEGRKCVDNDNGHGVSCWGIVASANNLSEQEDRNLTEDDAERIYKIKYWDKIHADDIAPTIRHLAFNYAIQFGTATAVKMIATANNNPYNLIQESSAYYQNLCNRNALYCGSLKGWMHRQDRLLLLENRILSANVEMASLNTDQNRQDAAPVAIPVVAQTTPKVAIPTAQTDSTQVASATDTEHAPADKNPNIVWSMAMLGLIKRRRRNGDGTADLPPLNTDSDEPMFHLEPIKKLVSDLASIADDAGATDEGMAFGSLKSTADAAALRALSDLEREAFRETYKDRHTQPYTTANTWRVDYPDQSYAIIERGRVHLHGDGGIEDALKYAAQAWGTQCALRGGTQQEREKIRVAAQKLVDTGDIAEGFTIAGWPPFMKTPKPEEDAHPPTPFLAPAPEWLARKYG